MRYKLIAAALAMSFISAAPVMAATVGFDGLSVGKSASVTSSGYTFTSPTIVVSNCGESKPCLGMTGVGSVAMTLTSGGTFTLESLWFKLRGANKQNALTVSSLSNGAKIDLTAAIYGRNNGQRVELGPLFTDVKDILFTTQGKADVRIDDIVANTSQVPVPAAMWMMVAGFGGLAAAARRRKAS